MLYQSEDLGVEYIELGSFEKAFVIHFEEGFRDLNELPLTAVSCIYFYLCLRVGLNPLH
jgi:hypothetical protein